MNSLPMVMTIFWATTGLMTACTALALARCLAPANARIATVAAMFIPAVALPLYLMLGRPELVEWHTRPRIPPFLKQAIEDMKQATAEHPDDPANWILLGDVNTKIQHYVEAEIAYRGALKAVPGDAAVAIALALTLVREAGSRVTPDALELFEAHAKEPAARYYIALAKSQAADWEGAMVDWQALAKAAKPDDAWTELTLDRITEARRVLGLDRDH